MTMTVRDATSDDAAACAAIYAPYVRDTAITFETEPPDAAEFARRIAAATARHAWLVLVGDGRVTGYAYGGPFKERAAYRFACEVSVYLEQGLRRSGGGRALYAALLPRLAERGYRTAAAGMTLPNEASVGLHRAVGSRRWAFSVGWGGSSAAGTTWRGPSVIWAAWASPRGRFVPIGENEVTTVPSTNRPNRWETT